MRDTPIHYDCDPGQDDAVALLYALGSNRLDILDVSVAGGNADVDKCAKNALQILELAQREDIPVYRGAPSPLFRELETLPQVFGITGMAGAEDLPDPKRSAIPMNAEMEFSSIVRARVIVATGPLTNLALYLRMYPDFSQSIDHLILMGGCVYPEPIHGKIGNFRPKGADDLAEYNFATDPEAVKIVFSSGIKKITMVGLEITRKVLYNIDVERRLRALGKKCASKAADILSTVGEEDQEDYVSLKISHDDPVRAMHDVVAMACAESPELFTFEILPIRIVTEAPPATAGQSLIDDQNFDHQSVHVATDLDIPRFLDAMVENIGRLP